MITLKKTFLTTLIIALAFPFLKAEAQLKTVSLSELGKQTFQSKFPQIQNIYTAALKNLDSQFKLMPDGTVYVSTGDIPAEWLRDSSVQVRPLLFFVKSNPKVAAFVKAVFARQIRYLAINPYANAFRSDYRVWENKFELDSISYPIILSWTYWKLTGDTSLFTSEAKKAFAAAFSVLKKEQNHNNDSAYYRKDLSPNPVRYTGMIWSGYRPSDDPCKYGYLIPGNLMVAQAMTALAEIQRMVFKDLPAATQSLKLQSEIIAAVYKYGTVNTKKYGKIFAYEVDGYGHANLMDDGNLPSLLGATLLGIRNDDPIYQNTRRFALSRDNPYFYSGSLGSGIGSPHTPKGMVWPLAVLARGFTAQNIQEKTDALALLLLSDPDDHLLHESFDPNNQRLLTRKDFGWPNAMYIEFVWTWLGHKPKLPSPQLP